MAQHPGMARLRPYRLHASLIAIVAFTASALMATAFSTVPTLARSHDLPLGDGHVSTQPKAGYVYSCRTVFRQGAARHAGAWIQGDTWNPAEKPHVAGKVLWPDAAFTFASSGSDMLLFKGDGLPVGEPTGHFPIAQTDPAYGYDTNPNRIAAQHLAFDIPASPVVADPPGCLPMGMIGFTTTGVALYSALDDAGRDAAAHEVQDLCDGHPQGNSQYHYHSGSLCIPGVDSNKLVGWALDGYPIFGMKDGDGRVLTDAALDACHGRAENVRINGRDYAYVYRLTREYPYTLGCFHGRLLDTTLEDVREGLLPRQQHRRPHGRKPSARRHHLDS